MAEQGWDVTKPIDHTKVSVLPEEIRGLRSSIKTVIQKEHVALGAANSGGQHLKGAARVYLDADLPGTDPESNNLDTSATSDDGRIAVVTAAATDAENTLKVYVATAAGISTGWEDIRVAEAGTSHRVRLANAVSIRGYRATGVSTTISLIKVNASNLPEIGSGSVAVVMPSAAPTADGQVANKKYVDDLAISVIKAWVQFDGDDATIQGTGFNVSGVVRNSVGNYTVTFSDALANNDYAVAGFCADATSGAGMVCNQSNSSPEATTTIEIETWDTEAAALADYGRVHVMVIGDQV